jgi:hypothetical protein
VSVPEDGDGITQQGIRAARPHFPIFLNRPVLPGGRRGSFLSKKRQNQQDPAREIVPKSLGFIGRMFGERSPLLTLCIAEPALARMRFREREKHQLELAVALYSGRNKGHKL